MYFCPASSTSLYVHMHTHTPHSTPPPRLHCAGRWCNHAVWLRTLAKEMLDQPEIFSQNNTMYQSQECGLTLQEVNMFSVFTQKMTFCLMMLILHCKHFILPKNIKIKACQVNNYKWQRRDRLIPATMSLNYPEDKYLKHNMT